MMSGEEREEGLELINKHVKTPMAHWPIKTIKALETGGVALFKITPSQISYLNLESKDQLQSLTNYFYEIYP